MRFDSELQQSIRGRLAAFSHQRADGATTRSENAGGKALKHAAVCLAVIDDGHGDAALVLTRRTSHLSAHKGQFALPGGRIDAGETEVQAALREAHEEVGLRMDESAVLGRLDDFQTRSGYVMTPIVVWVEDSSTLAANPREVAEIHRIQLGDLSHNNQPEFISIPESDRPVIRYPLVGTLIHAPTAALIYQFVEVALLGRNTRVAHLEQPVWAWK
ncbi:MAG TPA: CoA pyrophosphatase [Burkholderiales bacterium]|nr:CoA pyrophosphatase [Burkholderiales bacterium]